MLYRSLVIISLLGGFTAGSVSAADKAVNGVLVEAQGEEEVETTTALFPLAIIHINDFHARYEPTDRYGGTCDSTASTDGDDDCIGGYARTVYTVKQLQQQLAASNPIYINAGDSFYGTLWYNIGRWNVTSEFLNMLPADAMTLGNHEFDHDVAGVVPFLKTIDSPMLVANMDAQHEPTMQGLYNKTLVIERDHRKIGLIGALIATTPDLAFTGNLIFNDECATIRTEAERLRAEGVNIIIVISHCGYELDLVLAEQLADVIDVIVGGHSHHYLYTGEDNPSPDTPMGDYPTEVVLNGGIDGRVLIVTAGAYAKYVGNITVYFDEQGNVVRYEGAPIYMSADVPEDAEVLKAMLPWREQIDAFGTAIIGETKVDLLRAPCSYTECNLGNFFCDAMVHAFAALQPYESASWTSAPIAVANAGTFRVPLMKGNLSYSHLVTMSPYENILTAFNLPGEQLVAALEYSVSHIDLTNGITIASEFLQVSGIHVTYDYTRPVGERVVQLLVRCADCSVPKYEPLIAGRLYRVIATAFLVAGGEGFTMFRDYGTDLQPEMLEIEALVSYTQQITPIYTGVEGRIKILTGN